MAQLTLVLQILGHDISIGIGADIEKSQTESGEVLVVESSGDHTVRQVGFVRNDDEGEGDDGDEGRIRGRGLNGW